MEEARLSAYERRVLAEIEEDLSTDDGLARRMAGHRPPLRLPRPRFGGGRLGALTLGAATLALLVLAVATASPALTWAFAAAWVVTLILLLRMVVRWTRRHAAGGRPDD
ncbi:hypothetical protein GCM10017562_68910 [Streptomyces roseofulvus]|uniref:DUF3040 domain-containing protein n=1 Tax=Streptomyces TaxID=1883 RepID=UPI0031FDCA3D